MDGPLYNFVYLFFAKLPYAAQDNTLVSGEEAIRPNAALLSQRPRFKIIIT
jgi:hypothetical protein